MQKIKSEFQTITGENFDALSACDIPNYVGGNRSCKINVAKYSLYGDPFNAWLECKVKDGVREEYAEHAETLYAYATESKNYGYLFETLGALCDVLSVKYGLGIRTREAYAQKDVKALKAIIQEYELTQSKLEVFYRKFRALWYKENNPTGFDVQDLRLGGLKQRMSSCKERLEAYLADEIKNIPELEEKMLDCWPQEEIVGCSLWLRNVTMNIV